MCALFSAASGMAGAGLSRILSGVFGPMAIVLPFFIIGYGVLLIIGLVRGGDLKRIALIIAVFALLCILMASRYLEVTESGIMSLSGYTVAEVYAQSASDSGGGVFGTYIAKGLISFIGKPGLFILCIALIAISVIFIAGMSMSKAAGAVRDKNLSRREERQKRADEQTAYSKAGSKDGDTGSGAGRKPGRGAGRDAGRGAGGDAGRGSGRDAGRGSGGDAGRGSGRGAGRDAGRGAGMEAGPVDVTGIEPSHGGDRQGGMFRVPSFLGGSQPNAPATGMAEAGGAGHQRQIIDAVKNDETYGDLGKRGLTIEDTTVPFKPDDADGPGAGGEEAPEMRRARRPVRERAPEQPGAGLGKRPSGSMHYGSTQDDSNYRIPPSDLLSKGRGRVKTESTKVHESNAARLEQALRDFRVEARVVRVTVGPTVTRYEVEPAVGVKIQNIRSIEPDLARKLEVKSVRVVPMPGQSVIGIEAFNSTTSIVSLREMIDSDEFRAAPGKISFALGKNISGKSIIVDLREMPHLLIAGTTGSGKSVCINSILLSILYRAKPSEVKLILIDPKVVELKSYNDLPHLLVPVVTEPERAAMALSHAVVIMNDRYKKFAEYNVRNLQGFNEKVCRAGRPEEVLPEIVIVIDELSDLMMVASAKVQESISRLAAMARAAGMHLIVATQQPLASILTSVIKANIPSRIAFAVSSNSASRVILDNPGAERLHGKGDMLFSPVGTREALRIQGAFTDEKDVIKVVEYVKRQMDPDYSAELISKVDAAVAGSLIDDEDELFLDAVEMVAQSKQASVSMIQRRFRVGYNRAARLVDMMEERGIVAASDGTNKPRRLIMSEAQLSSFLTSSRPDTGYGGFADALAPSQGPGKAKGGQDDFPGGIEEADEFAVPPACIDQEETDD